MKLRRLRQSSPICAAVCGAREACSRAEMRLVCDQYAVVIDSYRSAGERTVFDHVHTESA